MAPVSNRTWTINAISPDALNICFQTFFAFAIATGLFWLSCGYRYFRPVLYQAGFLYGLYITLCVFASRIPLDAWLLFVLSLSGGLTLGLVFIATRRSGTYLFAFMTGILVGNTCVDQIPLVYFIPSNLISFIIILVTGIALTGLTFYYARHERHYLIVMTSYSGSCIIAGCVSQLALGDSRMLLLRDILSFPLSDRYQWPIGNYYFYIVFVCSLILTGIGLALQYFVSAKGYDFLALLEEAEAAKAQKEKDARDVRIPLRSPVNY